MNLKIVVQAVAALSIGVGVFLYYSGTSLLPKSGTSETYPNSMFKDESEQRTVAAGCRGAGIGLGVFGVVILVLTVRSSKTNPSPDRSSQ